MTYQAYYLLEHLGSAEDDVRTRSSWARSRSRSSSWSPPWSAGGSPTARAGARPSSARPRSCTAWRCSSSRVASDFDGFLVGMAVSGLGFGLYMAVDLALVADVLPDRASAAKDLGVFNIAGALPFSSAPAMAPLDPRGRLGSYAGAVRRRRAVCAPRRRGRPAREEGPLIEALLDLCPHHEP